MSNLSLWPLWVISIIAVLVCSVWLIVCFFILEAFLKRENLTYVGSSTEYSKYTLGEYLWCLKMSLFFWLFSIALALPIIGYTALYFYSYSKTVSLIEDNGEASFFYTLLFFITVVIVGFLSFAVYYLIKTYKRRKMVFDILMERAREYYPDFDTNPETKERVLRIISERTRWKDWPVDRFQITLVSCDLFADDAAKYKVTNSI